MINKVTPSIPHKEQHESKMTTVNISGDGNTLMARVDTVNNEYGPVYVINVPSSKGGFIQERVEAFNPDFYNLIVVGDEDLNETNHFLLDKTRVITESTSQELKNAYAALTPEAIAIIKTFPTIIATENHSYGKTDDDHMAVYGMLTDIKVQDNGIKVYYQGLNPVPQQKLNELAAELGFGKASSFNELNRVHWAIKKVNMVEVLREAGIKIFSL